MFMIDEMSFRVSRVIVRLKGIDLNQHERCDRPSIRNSNHIPNTVHLHVVSSRISKVKRILGSDHEESHYVYSGLTKGTCH